MVPHPPREDTRRPPPSWEEAKRGRGILSSDLEFGDLVPHPPLEDERRPPPRTGEAKMTRGAADFGLQIRNLEIWSPTRRSRTSGGLPPRTGEARGLRGARRIWNWKLGIWGFGPPLAALGHASASSVVGGGEEGVGDFGLQIRNSEIWSLTRRAGRASTSPYWERGRLVTWCWWGRGRLRLRGLSIGGRRRGASPGRRRRAGDLDFGGRC